MQLEESKEALRRNGLGVCAISYDGPEVLRHTAKEKHLTIPLLSDQGSEIIRAFNILDTSVAPDNPAYGVPLHGTYVVNEMGIVESKFFETNVGHTSGIVLTRLFGSPLNTHEKLVKHDHMSLRYYASSDSASAGDHINLTLEISLNDKIHVYAPLTTNHFPIAWELDPNPVISSQPVAYPSSQIFSLPLEQEKIPVYQGTFRVSRRITINPDHHEVLNPINSEGNLAIKGTLRFQACDDKVCYLPQSIPLTWKLQIAETRSP